MSSRIRQWFRRRGKPQLPPNVPVSYFGPEAEEQTYLSDQLTQRLRELGAQKFRIRLIDEQGRPVLDKSGRPVEVGLDAYEAVRGAFFGTWAHGLIGEKAPITAKQQNAFTELTGLVAYAESVWGKENRFVQKLRVLHEQARLDLAMRSFNEKQKGNVIIPAWLWVFMQALVGQRQPSLAEG